MIIFVLMMFYAGFFFLYSVSSGVVIYHILKFGLNKQRNQTAVLLYTACSALLWFILFLLLIRIANLYDGQII